MMIQISSVLAVGKKGEKEEGEGEGKGIFEI
jgi:hypothetical protein